MNRFLLLAIGIILSLSSQAQQQNSTNTEKFISDIENKISKLPDISGYIQIGYQWSDNENNTESTFHIRRARLSLSGKLQKQLVDYKLQLELSGSPKIVDAYINFTPYKALNIQVGQYKIPFSIENVDYSPSRLETIDYPMALQKLMGMDEKINGTTLKSSGRDIGITLHGSILPQDGYSLISYRVGVFNGAGINTKDNNSSKDLAARINIKPIKELVVSASYYKGEWDKAFMERERFAIGAAYDSPKDIFARSEYLWGKTNNIDSDGLYLLFGCHINNKLSSMVRYDTFRENKNLSDSQQTNYLIGFDYKMFNNVRLQLNYTLQHFEQNHQVAISTKHQKFSLIQMLLTGSF